MGATVCIAENRRSCEPALRLLLASLDRHCTGMPVELFCPDASDDFIEFTAQWDHVKLNPRPLRGEWTKYDIKPIALATVLSGEAEDAIWIDSDILVTRDFRPFFEKLSLSTVAVTEEALCSGHDDVDGLRARLWGFSVGRTLPFTANTGVVRVTREHIPLLHSWNELLQGAVYRKAQSQPWQLRGLHVMGDQEVLTALLASKQFAHLPIKFLRRGSEIIQFFGSSGYTLRERFHHLLGQKPYFVHSQGFRPWWPADLPGPGLAARFNALYNELSPYTVHARRYAFALESRDWLRPRSFAARIGVMMGAKSSALTGVPLAAVADAGRLTKHLRRKFSNVVRNQHSEIDGNNH